MNKMLKLKVSPKGQITLPKKLRSDLAIKDYVYLEVKQNRAVLKPASFTDEFEDLIVRDLIHEGYSSKEIARLLPEKKKDLSKAILKEMEDRSTEDSVSHEELLKELNED